MQRSTNTWLNLCTAMIKVKCEAQKAGDWNEMKTWIKLHNGEVCRVCWSSASRRWASWRLSSHVLSALFRLLCNKSLNILCKNKIKFLYNKFKLYANKSNLFCNLFIFSFNKITFLLQKITFLEFKKNIMQKYIIYSAKNIICMQINHILNEAMSLKCPF